LVRLKVPAARGPLQPDRQGDSQAQTQEGKGGPGQQVAVQLGEGEHPAAARAAAGMVTTQATVWVVDTGAPSAVEPNRATAAPVSAAIPGPAAAR
jgi:hypothetical protein